MRTLNLVTTEIDALQITPRKVTLGTEEAPIEGTEYVVTLVGAVLSEEGEKIPRQQDIVVLAGSKLEAVISEVVKHMTGQFAYRERLTDAKPKAYS